MSLHKFKTRTGHGRRLTTLAQNVNPKVSGWLPASQDTHMGISIFPTSMAMSRHTAVLQRGVHRGFPTDLRHRRHITRGFLPLVTSTPTTSPLMIMAAESILEESKQPYDQHNNMVNSQQYADHHIRQYEGTHNHTPAETVHNVNASPSMDVSVNFGPLSSISLQCQDAAAGAKGVRHRCLTKGVPRGHIADSGIAYAQARGDVRANQESHSINVTR